MWIWSEYNVLTADGGCYGNELNADKCGLFVPFCYLANVACLWRIYDLFMPCYVWPMWPVYEENECNPHPHGPSLARPRSVLCCKLYETWVKHVWAMPVTTNLNIVSQSEKDCSDAVLLLPQWRCFICRSPFEMVIMRLLPSYVPWLYPVCRVK